MGACAARESHLGPFATRTVELTKLVQHAKSTADGLQLSLWSLVSLWSHIPLQEVSELFHQFATKDDTVSAIHLITAMVLYNTEMSPWEKAHALLEFFDWKDKGELASADLLLVLSVGADVMGVIDRASFAALAASAFPAKTQSITDLSNWASEQDAFALIFSPDTPATDAEPTIEQDGLPRSTTTHTPDSPDGDPREERNQTEPALGNDDEGTMHRDSLVDEVSPQVVPTSSAKLEVEMETEEQALQRWTSSIEASLHFLDESAASNYRASVDHEHTSSTGHPLLTREYLAEQYQQITTKLSDVYSCCESPDLTAIWSRLEHAKEIDVERAEGRFLAAVDSWMEAHITRDSRLVDLEVGDPMGALAMKKSAENRMLEILNVIENDEEHHCLHWKLIGMDKFIAELPNYFRSKLRKMLKKDDAAVADDRSAEYAFDEPVLRELFMLRDVRESVSRLFRDEPVPNGGEQPSNGLTAVEADSGANAASPHIDERKRAGSATGWSKVEVAATVRREASRTFLRRRWLELGEAATAMVALTSRADGRMLKDNLARYVLTFASQRMKDESEVLSDEKEITKLFDALLKFQEESAGQKEPDQFELAVPIENVLAKLTTDETLDVARLQGSATLSEAIDTIRALLVDKKLARLPNALWSSWLGVSGALDISIRLSILSNDRRCVEAITVERLSLERLSFSKATIDVQGVLGAVHNLMQACSQDSAIMADEPLNFDTLLALPTISESTRLSLLLHDPAQPEFDLYLRAWAIAQNYVEKDAGQAGLHLLSVWRRRQVAPLEARALRNETARSQLAARAYLEALDPSDAMHIGPFIRQTQIGVEKELTKCHTEESFVEICGSIQALAMLAQLAQQDAPRSETPART